MLQSLLNNLTLLTTGILFGHILKSALTERLLAGWGDIKLTISRGSATYPNVDEAELFVKSGLFKVYKD